MVILTTDTTNIQTETDPDQTTTRVEVTPAKVSVRSVLSGMREAKVGPSSSPGDKSPAEPTGTDLTPALLLLLTETDSLGTGTRSRWLTGINPVTTGRSPATWCGMAALSLPGTRGLSLGPTSAPQTCQ